MSMLKVVVATHGIGYGGSTTYLVLSNKSLHEVHEELAVWHKKTYPDNSTMSVETYCNVNEMRVCDIDPAFDYIKVL